MRTLLSFLLLAIASPMASAQSQDDLLRQVMSELQKVNSRVDAIERQQATINAKVDIAMSNKSQFDALSSRIDAIVFEQPKANTQSVSAWGSPANSSSSWSGSAMMSSGACANGSCGAAGKSGIIRRILGR